MNLLSKILKGILLNLLKTDPDIRHAICLVTRQYSHVTCLENGDVIFHGLNKK